MITRILILLLFLLNVTNSGYLDFIILYIRINETFVPSNEQGIRKYRVILVDTDGHKNKDGEYVAKVMYDEAFENGDKKYEATDDHQVFLNLNYVSEVGVNIHVEDETSKKCVGVLWSTVRSYEDETNLIKGQQSSWLYGRNYTDDSFGFYKTEYYDEGFMGEWLWYTLGVFGLFIIIIFVCLIILVPISMIRNKAYLNTPRMMINPVMSAQMNPMPMNQMNPTMNQMNQMNPMPMNHQPIAISKK